MKTLKSMTDFVLSLRNQSNLNTANKDDLNNYYLIQRYAEFLKQPLTLGMFVPCNENGDFLESPYLETVFHSHYHLPVKFSNVTDEYVKEYEKAKEKVLFKSFSLENSKHKGVFDLISKNGSILFNPKYPINKNIEWLLDLNFKIELTENALKQIGL